MKCKEFVRNWSLLNLRYYPGISTERLRKTIKTHEDSRTLGKDLNPKATEYETGKPTTLLSEHNQFLKYKKQYAYFKVISQHVCSDYVKTKKTPVRIAGLQARFKTDLPI
jgi:hypothetical protein